MKKCSWCGKEYPDTAEICATDAQPLVGGPEPIAVPTPIEAAPPPPPVETAAPDTITSRPPRDLTDSQMRVIEIVLLCLVAFGGTVLHQAQLLLLKREFPLSGGRNWLYGCLHQLTALGLLWYILRRRSRSISDLGLSWQNKDLLRSVLLFVMGTVAFSIAYAAIYNTGLTTTPHSAGTARATKIIFGSGVTLLAFAFQFINPLFEELIVRAYLMTEIRELTRSTAKAILASTLLQTSYHIYQGGPMTFAEAAIFLVFSLYYAKTNRITPIILAHFYMDLLGTVEFMFAKH